MEKCAVVSLQKGIYVFPSFLPEALLAFSTREFDASKDLLFFLKSLGISPERSFTIKQVHGNHVVWARSPNLNETIEADGIVTQEKGLALVIRTADCVPLFLWDPESQAVGLVHVGWRGAQKGIVRQAVEMLEQTFQSKPPRLLAALGPAIRECCYEVGEEFQNYFPGFVRESAGKHRFDLAGFVKSGLEALGIPKNSMIDSGICTACSVGRFFSARRESQETGRFPSVIMIKCPSEKGRKL